MSEEKEVVLMLVVEEGTGRQIIGELCEHTEETITLKNPLLILERVLQAQGMQDGQQQIMLNISPIMHTFIIDTWTFKWAGFHKVTDQKLMHAFEDFNIKMRAARSNLSVARTMPPEGGIQLAKR